MNKEILKKKFVFLLPILTLLLISVNNVNALTDYHIYAVDQDNSSILRTNGNSITSNPVYYTASNIQQRVTYQLELWGVIPSEQFFQLKLRLCTTGINGGVSTSGYDTSGAFANGQHYPTNSNSIGTCNVDGYTGTLYEHKYFLTFGGNIPTSGDYSQFSYIGNIITWGGSSVNYRSVSQILNANLVPITEDDLLNAQDKLQTDTIINNQNQINSNLTNETPPNLNGLNNSAGWLKPGPVDSILNLPLTLLNNLQTNLGNTCNPVSLTLPYVDKDISLPCVSAIYKQIDGLDVWFQGIGVIAAAFILYRYFMYLYNRVDDTLSFRENNMQGYFDDSLWGGM